VMFNTLTPLLYVFERLFTCIILKMFKSLWFKSL